MAAVLLLLAIAAAGCAPGIGGDGGLAEDPDIDEARQVQLEIREGPEDSTLAFVPVYVHGEGPYLFALDTGASRSTIDIDVVREAGIELTGRSRTATGVGGEVEVQLAEVEQWRAGEVPLPAGEFTVLDLPSEPGEGLQGLLGSDVLQAFDAITIDYRDGVLTFDPR